MSDGKFMQQVGHGMDGMTAFADGMNQNKALRFEAIQMRQMADTERAIGTRQVQEMRRQKRIAISDMVAQMAAGGGAMDANMVKLQAKTATRFDQNAAMAKWMADTKGRSLDLKADALEFQAKAAKAKGLGKAVSSVIKMANV